MVCNNLESSCVRSGCGHAWGTPRRDFAVSKSVTQWPDLVRVVVAIDRAAARARTPTRPASSSPARTRTAAAMCWPTSPAITRRSSGPASPSPPIRATVPTGSSPRSITAARWSRRLDLDHMRVIEMVTDSLRYWATETHVDGFRFDLGTILARQANGFDKQSGFLKACCQDPVLRTVKLIAEPWDCGPGGYQVGGFPPGWAEWNDKFRDTVRDFWRRKAPASAFAPRLCASGDIFNHRGRKPWACINFITVHDGFTLSDLVSYNDKHNEANGEDNKDGQADNHSWNSGAEGPTDDDEVNALRGRRRRNCLATLLLARNRKMLWGGRRGKVATSSLHLTDGVCAMPQPNDLSRSLVALDQNSTIIAVVELSQSSWLVGGVVPGIESQGYAKQR